MTRIRCIVLAGLFLWPSRGLAQETVVVDACEELSSWSAHPADGVSLELATDEGWRGRSVRLDFDIPGGGYAVARIDVDLELPDNYAFRFHLRGDAPPNHLEFKLLDETGDSVWWSVRRDFAFPTRWTRLSVKKRHLDFAWGPKGGGEIRRVSAIELAITAGRGGTGRVWIDEIELIPVAPPDASPPAPIASATSARVDGLAAHATDGDLETAWESELRDVYPSLTLDLTRLREYSGLLVRWHADRHAADYLVEASDDGVGWSTLRTVVGANGGLDRHHLPESESRYLRLRILRASLAAGVALAELELMPVDWAESRQQFFEHIASDAPRGQTPRGMRGEQSYWTIVGVDADPREALLGEDGALEFGMGLGSIEPFVFVDGSLVTWADAQIEQSLDEGSLPIPSVHWTGSAADLQVTAFGRGDAGASSVIVRYRVANPTGIPITPTLYVALRPYQVNPPSQTLNLTGGVAPIHSISFDADGAIVDGERRIRTITAATDFGAASFDQGDVVIDFLAHGRLPDRTRVDDRFGAASAALAYSLELDPGESQTVDILVPLYADAAVESSTLSSDWVDRELEQCRSRWRERVDRVTIDLPPVADEIELTLESQLCYILLNRAGPAIQPGPRSYARSWIRDGALTSSALLRLGHDEPARAFLEWYAPHQYEHGKIPCVVDSRGADPVDEHDSSGEFIFLVAEVYRFTKDTELLASMWPRVLRAADYLDGLRQQRRTDEYEGTDQAAYFGILPPSISHEGYSAKPMHSYWDDFFAVRGFRDAVFLAEILGHEDEAQRLAAIRDEFELDFSASVVAAMRDHTIDYVPGCADLGDFDPTSTTIALTPAEAERLLPDGALVRTFERYYDFFVDRRDHSPWDAFTPYELRSVGSFVRLGWRDRAMELLEFFLDTQRPTGWRQWPEVVRSDPRKSGFLGDLPHTWVGSDYVRSVLDMLAYETGGRIVVGAGVPGAWLEAPGTRVQGLPTSHGPLDFSAVIQDGDLHVDVRGEQIATGVPVELRFPDLGSAREVLVDGRPEIVGADGGIHLRQLPARVTVHW